jgi:hypothetical protein
MVTKTPSIGALAAALVKAQAEVMAAHRDAKNPHFKSTYATIESVLDAIREPLSKNGIAFVQFPSTVWKEARLHLALTTILMHTSGEMLEGTLEIPVSKADAQGVASATTYARRIALQAIAGVAAEDDDGNASVGRSEPPKQQQPPQQPQPPRQTAVRDVTPTAPQLASPPKQTPEEKMQPEELEGRAKKLGFFNYEQQKKQVGGLWGTVKKANATKNALKLFLLERYEVESTYDLTKAAVADACDYLGGVAAGQNPPLVEPGAPEVSKNDAVSKSSTADEKGPY